MKILMTLLLRKTTMKLQVVPLALGPTEISISEMLRQVLIEFLIEARIGRTLTLAIVFVG